MTNIQKTTKNMKKTYSAPVSAVLNISTSGLIAASDPKKQDKYSGKPQLSRREGFGDFLWDNEDTEE